MVSGWRRLAIEGDEVPPAGSGYAGPPVPQPVTSSGVRGSTASTAPTGETGAHTSRTTSRSRSPRAGENSQDVLAISRITQHALEPDASSFMQTGSGGRAWSRRP